MGVGGVVGVGASGWFQLVSFQLSVESDARLRGASLLVIRLGNIWNHLPAGESKHVCVCLPGLPGMLSLCYSATTPENK